jgi:hypothetical protein
MLPTESTGEIMPLTGDFKETVQARLARDPEYREELLRESIKCLLSGDLDTGKAILRALVMRS